MMLDLDLICPYNWDFCICPYNNIPYNNNIPALRVTQAHNVEKNAPSTMPLILK